MKQLLSLSQKSKLGFQPFKSSAFRFCEKISPVKAKNFGLKFKENQRVSLVNSFDVFDFKTDHKGFAALSVLDSSSSVKSGSMSAKLAVNSETEYKLKTKRQIIEKHISSKGDSEISKILNSKFRQELYPSRDANGVAHEELDELARFIKNCITYRLDHYLTSISYFKNNLLRNRVLDTDTLEYEYQLKNPSSRKSTIINDLSIKRRYTEILEKHSKKVQIPGSVDQKYDIAKYEYFNHEADSVNGKHELARKANRVANQKLIELCLENNLAYDHGSDPLKLDHMTEQRVLLENLRLKEKQNFEHESGKSIAEDAYELQNFEEKRDHLILKLAPKISYPGNQKGPNPEDDIDNFISWFKHNHTKEVYEAFMRTIDRETEREEGLKQAVAGSAHYEVSKEETLSYENKVAKKLLPDRDYLINDDYLINSSTDEQLPLIPDEEDLDKYEDNLCEVWESSLPTTFSGVVSPIPPKLHTKAYEMNMDFQSWFEMGHTVDERRWREVDNELYRNFDPILKIKNDTLKYHNILTKKIYSSSLITLLDLYPAEVRENTTVRNVIQIFSRFHPFTSFQVVHEIVDFFATCQIPLSEIDSEDNLYTLESMHRYPQTMKNVKKFLMINWQKNEIVPGPEYYSSKDDDYIETFFKFMDPELKIEYIEEEDTKEKKRLEMMEKRELEDAKEQGKEAMDALKKKKEEEQKIKDEEDAKKEEEEMEVFLAEKAAKEKEKEEKEKQLEKLQQEEGGDDKGNESNEGEVKISKTTVYIPDEELDQNLILDLNDILGTDSKRKYMTDAILPTLDLNFVDNSKERLRYIELHNKLTKFLITPEEEIEFTEMLNYRDSNPELYSKITGIPLEELNLISESKKSFTETYFKDATKLKFSEAELQLIEREVTSLENKKNINDLNDDDDNRVNEIYFPPIPDYTQPQTPHLQKFPIDFYDNDDGFWDDYIKEKKDCFDVSNIKIKPYSTFHDFLEKYDDV